MRTLLFTGKGGVGKTTIAAATAVHCADQGLRTLVISTDSAHSLGDALDVELDGQVRVVAPNLSAQQIDAQERMEESWSELRDYLVEVFDWAGLDGLHAEELLVLPGLDELFALGDIKQFADSGDWDVLVVDCAPTAETIRLLSLPDLIEWYMDRLFPVGRRINRLMSPVLTKVTSLPLADDEVFGATHRLYRRLEGVKSLLSDAEHSSIRLVVQPERVVIAEARRTHTYLSLFGYRVDAVVANRLIPDTVEDPWMSRWREIHAAHVADIEEVFAPLPVLRSPWADEEPVGLDLLRQLAKGLYADVDAAAVLHTGEPYAVTKEGDRFVIRLELPFAAKQDVDLSRQGDELIIGVGPYRRSLVLPASLRRRVVESAKLDDGVLRVTFAPTATDRNGQPRPSKPRRANTS